jgi:hypothetical protein
LWVCSAPWSGSISAAAVERRNSRRLDLVNNVLAADDYRSRFSLRVNGSLIRSDA